MTNKTIANFLIGVLVLAVWGGMIDAGDEFYTMIGLGYFIFSIIAIVRLYKIS